MKRFSLGIAAVTLAASLSSYAAFPTDAAPFQVNIPNLEPGFEASFTGYALRPEDSLEDYALVGPTADAIAASTIDQTSFTYTLKAVDPDYDWAFAVMVGYIFPCSGNDVRVSWIHFDQSDSDSTSVPTPNATTLPLSSPFSVVGPTWDLGLGGTFPSDFVAATGTEDFKYDAVDLDVGQFVNFGTRLQARLFGGLRYGHLERNLTTTFTGATTAAFTGATVTPAVVTVVYDSKYDGVGPLFGVDTSYHLWRCFGIVAHADMTLLVGQVKASDTFTTPLYPTPFPTTEPTVGTATTTINSDDTTRVVPGFDGKLGLDWSHIFTYGCDCNEAVVSIEAGYQWTWYDDPVDQLIPTTTGTAVDGSLPGATADNPFNVNSVDRESSNLTFDGPYVTISLKI